MVSLLLHKGIALTSLPVVLLESLNCKTFFFNNWCALNNYHSGISCRISLKKVAVLVTWVFQLRLLVAVAPSSGIEFIISSLEAVLPAAMKLILPGSFRTGLIGTLLLKDAEQQFFRLLLRLDCVSYSQTCSNNHFYKTTTRWRRAILSPRKQILL